MELFCQNGAGKTTTIEMLSTIVKPDGGYITIDGHEIGKEDNLIRKSIGVVFQGNFLDDILTVEENLMLRGKLYKTNKKTLKESIDRVCDITMIHDIMKRPYGKLSGGQRRKVDIARALINTPKLLILDEPTVGLDAQTRINIWDTIIKLKDDYGVSVLLTTHYLEEAKNADNIVVIEQGSVVEDSNPSQILENYTQDYLVVECTDVEDVKDSISNLDLEYKQNGNLLTMKLHNTVDAIHIVEQIKDKIMSLEIKKGSMDEAFLNIIKGVKVDGINI